MAKLFSLPKQIPLTSGGAVLPGAKLTFSATGTSTLQNTYQDSALSTAHANPVVADADGVFAPIYFDPSLPNYRVRLTTSADVLVYQVDGVPSNENEAQQFDLIATSPQILFHETDAAANRGKWLVGVAAENFRVALLNDAEVIQSNVFLMERTGLASVTFSFLQSASGNLGILASGSGNVEVLAGGTGLFSYKTLEVSALSSGQFTATVTGFSNVSQLNIEWIRIGSPSGNAVVVMSVPGFSGTSNATTFTITGIPAGIAATLGLLQPIFVTDNGSNVAGNARIVIGAATTITFGVGAASGGFTGSGTKGLPGEYTQLIYRTTS